VQLIRNSLDFCSWKDRKPVAKELKAVYRAADAEAASPALTDFEEGPWGKRFAAITALWAPVLDACHSSSIVNQPAQHTKFLTVPTAAVKSAPMLASLDRDLMNCHRKRF
jgi:transposase-like protein